MKLEPYPSRALRAEKIVRHYFDPTERWWEVTKPSFVEWSSQWNQVRASGAFFESEGWLQIQEGTDADKVVSDAHDLWLEAAEVACDEALERQTVFPSGHRTSYVGYPGITVIAAEEGDRHHLVTAWRTAPRWLSGPNPTAGADQKAVDAAKNKSRVIDRAAVRRLSRQASYRQKSTLGGTRDAN
tara:strand:+ start:33043 stop:33597 length:555 start_codon:yes stop_codon:yes gene_type:complete